MSFNKARVLHNTIDDEEFDPDTLRSRIDGIPSGHVPAGSVKTPNYVGPASAAQKLAHLLAQATPGTDVDDITAIVTSLVTDITKSAKASKPEPPALEFQYPKGFFGPKRGDFDSSKQPFWKHFQAIELDHFSGKQGTKTFAAWWSLFDQEIHKLPDAYCPDTIRMRALYKLLDDEPKTLIEPFHTNITQDSYKQAVQLLNSRYGANERTKENLKDKLRALKPANSSCTAQVEFINKLQMATADLQVAGESQYEAMLFAMKAALRKLSSKYSDKYYVAQGLRTKRDKETFYVDDPTTQLLHLQTWINNLKAESLSSDDEDHTPATVADSTVSSFVATTPSPKKYVKPRSVRAFRCPYHRTDDHTWMNCKLSLEEKKKIIKEKQLCENCLREGHFTAKCPSEGVCYFCLAESDKWCYHHTSICMSKTAAQARASGKPYNWALLRGKVKERSPRKTTPSQPKQKYQKLRQNWTKFSPEKRASFSTMLKELDSEASLHTATDQDESDSAPCKPPETTEAVAEQPETEKSTKPTPD